MAIQQEIRLIFAEIGKNSYKQWRGVLHDNGDVQTFWGRVGETEQNKMFPGKGEAFLLKKQAEKLKKGYEAVQTIASGTTTVKTIERGNLLDIARTQIKTNSPKLDSLIARLVQDNIHQITSSTDVSYNANSGLFETPLGIVTLDGITQARTILSESLTLIQAGDYGDAMIKQINKYLRIVPQSLGMRKLDPRNFFPDIHAIQKQNDILDSLESSFNVLSNTKENDSVSSSGITETVFKVRLETLDDEVERARILKKYKDTRKDMHVCAHLKIKEIYVVELEDNARAFEEGSKVGQIRELWHGTKKANLLSILKSGLKVAPPSTARIAGKMFGNGIYFAIDSTKSLNYSYGYWDGSREQNCFMFLASVAMGKHYTPRGTYESLPKAGFDSTWAKSGQSGIMNDEFVVYDDSRFKLNYLVEFE